MFREKKTTSWESDIDLARELAEKLSKADGNPEKYAAIMEENTAEIVSTFQFPPMSSRDGVGSKRVWLDCEYASNLISKEKYHKGDGKRVRRRNIRAYGNAVVLDEYRVYPLADKKLCELHALIIFPVYNGKIIGYFAFADPMPSNNTGDDNEEQQLFAEDEKIKKFNEIIKNLPELDKSEIPYYQQ